MAVTPVHIPEAVRANDLEQYVMLTTLEKALAWGQSNSIWPAGFGLACCAIEMMVAALAAATTSPASAPRCSAPRRARPT